MFLFLCAKIQGFFIGAYVGGLWNTSSHEYKRETPKDEVRKKAWEDDILTKNNIPKVFEEMATDIKAAINEKAIVEDLLKNFSLDKFRVLLADTQKAIAGTDKEDLKQKITRIQDIIKDQAPKPTTTFLPKRDNNTPVYNSNEYPKTDEGEGKKEEVWVEQKGTVYPESKIYPIAGGSFGYLWSITGHAFIGFEIGFLKPWIPIDYKLMVEQDQKHDVARTEYGKLSVDITCGVNPSLVIGKELNPYTSLYAKIGGLFTHTTLTYQIENENPPFPIDEQDTFTAQKTQTYKDIWLKNVSCGAGVMFVNGNWIWALEYNFIIPWATTIRSYGADKDHGDEYHFRGYMHTQMDHRLMLRLMYMKRL